MRYTNGTAPTTYRYTGQREEASFGLYYYNARWYDPALGRFAQADTIVPGGVQGLDRYAYVNNNPVKYNDPSGYMWVNPDGHAGGGEYTYSTQDKIDFIKEKLKIDTGTKDRVALDSIFRKTKQAYSQINILENNLATLLKKLGITQDIPILKKMGQVIFINSMIIFPIDVLLLASTIATAYFQTQWAEAILFPIDIFIIDVNFSSAIYIYELSSNGKNASFKLYITPALLSYLPKPIQNRIHEINPIFVP